MPERYGAPFWEQGSSPAPTRVRTRLSTTPDGDKAIAKRFPDDVRRNVFLQKCHGPAVALADLDQGGEQAVTKALLDVHARIDTAWDRLPKNLQTLADLGPLRVLECFVDWLGEQEWISRRGPSMFTNEKLFTSFYREYMQNLGIHAGDYTGPDGRTSASTPGTTRGLTGGRRGRRARVF